MLKSLLAAAFTALFTASTFAAGPAQIWRLEVTAGAEDIVEISELQLMETSGGSNAVDLIRTFTFNETDPAGSATWSISHNLGVQQKLTSVDVIAYEVTTVAPGDYFYNTSSLVLSVRTNLGYDELEYVISETAPTTPEVGDIWFKSSTTEFSSWNGATWDLLTVTSTTSALPQPTAIDPDTTDIVLDPLGENNTVELTFSQAVVGAATVRGISFDTPANDRPGVAIPPVEQLENRPGAAVFDNNTASWFKSVRAPTERNPLALQYTYWVGEPDRYPNVIEYSITVRTTETAPRSWRLMYWMDGGWKLADQQAGIRFEDGETKTFAVD